MLVAGLVAGLIAILLASRHDKTPRTDEQKFDRMQSLDRKRSWVRSPWLSWAVAGIDRVRGNSLDEKLKAEFDALQLELEQSGYFVELQIAFPQVGANHWFISTNLFFEWKRTGRYFKAIHNSQDNRIHLLSRTNDVVHWQTFIEQLATRAAQAEEKAAN
jgi:hypothetical protein